MSKKNVIANRYEVISHVGQGGMADVFLAVDTILNRQVAIKILRADMSGDHVALLRFEREAQAAAALAHPNIVEIYDVGEYKNHHYIVMEYVPGQTLKQVIRSRGPLLTEEAVDIMKQLCSAVGEAHSRGIIHRDIKPQNVIVKADGSIKILDFGIATAQGSMQLTQTNSVMGSVHYLAPEVVHGDGASNQSDIYALGVVLYEMLAGEVPFNADEAVQIAIKHMREPFPSIRALNPNIPQSVENVITKAVAKDRKLRYQSVDEMYRDISNCLRPEKMHEKKLVLHDSFVKSIQQGQQDEQETPKRSAKNKKAQNRHQQTRVLVMIVAGLACVALIASLLFRFLQRNVKVPEVVGLSINEATAILEDNGLQVNNDNITYSLTTDTEKGTIIAVEPDEGENVEKGSAVRLTVSSGIGINAESYVGQNINTVVDELNRQYPHMKINIQEETNDASSGTIIRQEQLMPGDLFDPQSAVQITLIYSSYETITIPDDIIGEEISAATQRLESMGIVVRTSNRDTTQMSQEELDALQVGIVIDCNPAAGTSYTQKENNYVTLYYY